MLHFSNRIHAANLNWSADISIKYLMNEIRQTSIRQAISFGVIINNQEFRSIESTKQALQSRDNLYNDLVNFKCPLWMTSFKKFSKTLDPNRQPLICIFRLNDYMAAFIRMCRCVLQHFLSLGNPMDD